MDLTLTAVSFAVGVFIGLTGMGAGALLTPILVLFFGMPPSVAVSSDLAAAAVTKPVAGLVHLRNRTVDLRIVGWLTLGSVPAACTGVFLLYRFSPGSGTELVVRIALGCCLLLTVAVGLLRALFEKPGQAAGGVRIRPLRTVAAGAVAGVLVGLTSVGSGSLVMVALLSLYPALGMQRMVGTDLVQAAPLVLAAALSHALLGTVDLTVSASMVIGAAPGAFVGARWSTQATNAALKPVLYLALTAAGLAMLGVGYVVLLAVVAGLGGVLLLSWLSRRTG
jgi:uncharacterized protein